IPSDRARARDGRLAGPWFLAPRGLRASPTRSFVVTLTFRVLTPMISTRPPRVQGAPAKRARRPVAAGRGPHAPVLRRGGAGAGPGGGGARPCSAAREHARREAGGRARAGRGRRGRRGRRAAAHGGTAARRHGEGPAPREVRALRQQ